MYGHGVLLRVQHIQVATGTLNKGFVGAGFEGDIEGKRDREKISSQIQGLISDGKCFSKEISRVVDRLSDLEVRGLLEQGTGELRPEVRRPNPSS